MQSEANLLERTHDEDAMGWIEVEEGVAIEKCMQALRENGSPAMTPRIMQQREQDLRRPRQGIESDVVRALGPQVQSISGAAAYASAPFMAHVVGDAGMACGVPPFHGYTPTVIPSSLMPIPTTKNLCKSRRNHHVLPDQEQSVLASAAIPNGDPRAPSIVACRPGWHGNANGTSSSTSI